MSLEMRWCGIEERGRVAEARWKSFGISEKERARFEEGVATDHGTCPKDFLLAEVNKEIAGTATVVPMGMWVRGHRIACQGVAYVGTARTHRRGGGGEKGVASKIMTDVLKRAREQGEVVSALMPFRASFYEHFGYGTVERRAEWTIPTGILPEGDCRGMRFYSESDRAGLSECKQRIAEAGQCEIERTEEMWNWNLSKAKDGITVVDRDEKGMVHGWMTMMHEAEEGKDRARVTDWGYDSTAGLKRLLSFLGGLKDQYASVAVTVQADVPVNWLLKETQLPHRLVNHPVAIARPYGRMQLRVLDHKKLIEGMRWPAGVRGSAVVEVRESEGGVSKFKVEVEGGGAVVTSSGAAAEFVCFDRMWAAVVCGDMSASKALRYGLASGSEEMAGVLDALTVGEAPFCREYF
jgi:predicted acetyltransferase